MSQQHTLPSKRQERQLTVAECIQFLLELDDAIISPRPSIPLKAARIMQSLAVLADLHIGEHRHSRYEELEEALATEFASYNTSPRRARGDRTGW